MPIIQFVFSIATIIMYKCICTAIFDMLAMFSIIVSQFKYAIYMHGHTIELATYIRMTKNRMTVKKVSYTSNKNTSVLAMSKYLDTSASVACNK